MDEKRTARLITLQQRAASTDRRTQACATSCSADIFRACDLVTVGGFGFDAPTWTN